MTRAKPLTKRRLFPDLIGPVLLFIPTTSIAAIYGFRAETLGLPTAWFAQSSHFWMLALMAVSWALPVSKWATTVWLAGVACIAYAPLLVFLGSSLIPLSRPLTCQSMRTSGIAFPFPC